MNKIARKQKNSFPIFKSKYTIAANVTLNPHHMDLHHPITREFPEHREAIKYLKGTSEQFRNAFAEYHRLDDAIYRIEEEIDFASDEEFETLRFQRARLKDYIFHAIAQANPNAAHENAEVVELHHPIAREFPQHLHAIRQLKGSNAEFRRAFDEYHRIDDAIYRIEEDIDFATDEEIENLKYERARLKDWIFHALTHAPVPVNGQPVLR